MSKQLPIPFEERKIIQLNMLKEIDFFCKNQNIKYSLAFGTLLGAVRHKGFIPWDDDVDIMMPLEDMLKFKELFKSENMRYCDVDTEPYYEWPFSRIAHNNTYNKIGIVAKGYGISIDLYPVIIIPEENSKREKFFHNAINFQQKRYKYIKWCRRIVKYFPIKTIPGFKEANVKFRDYLLNTNIKLHDGLYFIVAGTSKRIEKYIFNTNLFNQVIDIEFENLKFCSIKNYDHYLTKIYGDYMTPPPPDKRIPYHGGCYYWKD